MSRLPNASALISLQEAADYAGYSSVSTLRKAARTGQLPVIQPSPRVILTTEAWVDASDVSVVGKGGRPRGMPRLCTKGAKTALPLTEERYAVCLCSLALMIGPWRHDLRLCEAPP